MDQSTKDENPNDVPRRHWWRWVRYVLMAWVVITTIFWALFLPWTWNTNQYLLVGFIAVTALWAFAWWWRGTEGIKDTLAKARKLNVDPAYKSFNRWNIVFWIAVAIGLVIFFNLTGNR